MKDSIGGMWLLGIIMTFMVLLITFVTLSLNYSTVFRLKSDMINAIEESNGFNTQTKIKIDGIISDYGYKTFKTCSFKEHTGNVLGILKDSSGDAPPLVNNYTRPVNYCIIREKNHTSRARTETYYTIQVFFGFDLPVLGDIFTFRVNGETNQVIYANDAGYDQYFGN